MSSTPSQRPDRRRGLVIAALALALVAALSAWALAARNNQSARAVTYSSVGGGIPAEALVTCYDGSTHVQTPLVQAASGGLHILVDNRAGYALETDVRGESVSFGRFVPTGLGEALDPRSLDEFEPGTIRIRCVDLHRRAPNAHAGAFASFELVDRTGVWTSDHVKCSDHAETYGHGYIEDDLKGAKGDVLEVARKDFASVLEPGDELRVVGYRQAFSPEVALVRGGRPVAVERYGPDGRGGWLQGDVTYCSEVANGGPPG